MRVVLCQAPLTGGSVGSGGAVKRTRAQALGV